MVKIGKRLAFFGGQMKTVLLLFLLLLENIGFCYTLPLDFILSEVNKLCINEKINNIKGTITLNGQTNNISASINGAKVILTISESDESISGKNITEPDLKF